MSALGVQVDRLRKMADSMGERGCEIGTDYGLGQGLSDASVILREAADTIESLSDKLQGVMGTRYCELFGTPERAARTIVDRELGYRLMKCEDYDELLEWLRGDA